MIIEVGAVPFRQNLGEMLERVQYRNDTVVVTRHGKPVAALIDAALFARIRRRQERFDALAERLAADFAESSREDGLTAIERAAADVRGEWRTGRG